jgi:hypothetical protein
VGGDKLEGAAKGYKGGRRGQEVGGEEEFVIDGFKGLEYIGKELLAYPKVERL